MKVLILNSGMGTRMGVLTKEHPKCMTDISSSESILSRQLKIIAGSGITDVIMTTGYFEDVLKEYCDSLKLPLNITFIKNPHYSQTNYIYSIYCARQALDDDIIMMHGDLVFDEKVFKSILTSNRNCMAASTTSPLPEKDFKAVVDGDRIKKVGVEFFENALTAQALYKINKESWNLWLDKISEFCENDNTKCYAENAFNEISDICELYVCDFKDELCNEIDDATDLEYVVSRLRELNDL